MLNNSTNIVVIGAGAVGSFFGGLLTKAGYPVLLIAKEPVASALNSQGLTIKWANADEHIAIQASANYADTAQAKLVLVCVKTPDTENLALQIKPFLAPDAVVAPVPPFANGSAPETLLVKSTVFNKSIHLLALAPVE